ncbi:MAG: polysaccharide deacetylase family protein [Rhodospirillaceae bacterium]
MVSLVASLWTLSVSYAAERGDTAAIVLMYHRFDDNRYPSTNTSMENFRAHVETIKNEGFTIVPLADVVGALTSQTSLPANSVAITIDDAYDSVYEKAWPYLRENEIPFTLFVATQPVANGQPGYMTPAQLRELANAPGVSIANHGHTHRSLAFVDRKTAREEIDVAAKLLTEWTGAAPPDVFAYPYGEMGEGALQAVDDFGFAAAFGQHSGPAGAFQGRYYLSRFPMSGSYANLDRLREALNTRPLPHSTFSPAGAAVRHTSPPDYIEFTLSSNLERARLTCFSGGSRIDVEGDGQRILVPFPSNPEPPRWRLNCTHPAPNGRWYWLGWQAAVENGESRE